MSCRGGVREIVVEAFPFDTPVLWRAAKVRAVTGLPERALRTGGFPKAVPLDARQVAWVANEVIAWNNIMGTAASRREPAVRKVCAVMDTIPRDAPVLWRLEKVCEVTGLTARSVRNRERIGKFPKAVPHNRLLLSLAHGFGHTIKNFGNKDFCAGGPLALS